MQEFSLEAWKLRQFGETAAVPALLTGSSICGSDHTL
jgi:hypothetical protein